jgi:hypothetical protein
MGIVALRRKSVPLNQKKLDRARTILGAKSDAETLDRALDFVVSDAAIDAALRAACGKMRLRKVFR